VVGVRSPARAWQQFNSFLSETRSELKKVTFPSRDEVLATTVVVVIASFIFAFFLWVADIVILKVYEGIFRVLS
jgi:preprotein translocase subunit SecE